MRSWKYHRFIKIDQVLNLQMRLGRQFRALLTLLLWVNLAHCQISMSELANHYPFLDTAKNHLEFYGSHGSFESMLVRLDSVVFLNDGQFNVVHVGGSHVQGGTLSNRLRNNFEGLTSHEDAPRGFLFPYRLAKTNSPNNIKIVRTGNWTGFRSSVPSHNSKWGISGVTAITTDTSASFSCLSVRPSGQRYSFKTLHLFTDFEESTMIPSIEPISDSTSLDSIAGVISYYYNHPVDSVYFSFKNYEDTNKLTDSEHSFSNKANGGEKFLIQGLYFDSRNSGVLYHALGVNGASTESFLRTSRTVEQGKYLAPDLVIFGLGINDAYKPDTDWDPLIFEARYDTIVGLFRLLNPEVQFIFCTNSDSYYKRKYPNPHALDVIQVMRRLSLKHNGAVWDLFQVMGGLNSIAVWEDYDLSKRDKIHFTEKGYQVNADLLFWAFWKEYEEHIIGLAK